MRLLLFVAILSTTLAASAGTLTKRKAVYPDSGSASGSLTVNMQSNTLKHSYLMPAPGQTCPDSKEGALQAYISDRQINDFTLLSPVRLDQQRALGLSYVLVRLCPSTAKVLGVDVWHSKLGSAGYVSLPPPFAFKLEKHKDGSIGGSGEMVAPALFLSNEYQFSATFKAKLLKIEPL